MKRPRQILTALAALALALTAPTAHAQIHAQYFFSDFTLSPQGVKRIEITPIEAYTVSGTNIVTGDKITRTVSSGGSITISNITAGSYRVEFSGASVKTTFTNSFGTNVSGLVNAMDYLTISTNLPGGNSAYSQSASDNLYLRKTGGTITGTLSVSSTNTAAQFVGNVTGSSTNILAGAVLPIVNAGNATNVTAHALDSSASSEVTNIVNTAISNTPVISVTDNGSNLLLSITAPLVSPTNIQATGFTLGSVTVTQWPPIIVPLRLMAVGPGVAMDMATTNAVAFNCPILADACDKSTNYVYLKGWLPSELLPNNYTSSIVMIFSRSGANGDVVTSVALAQSTAIPGSFGAATLSTNTFTGSGARWFAITNYTQVQNAGDKITVQVARDGDDPADTLTVSAAFQDAYLEFRRR